MVAVVSIALSMALESAYRFSFGSGLNSFDMPIARDMKFGSIRVGLQQLHNLEIAIGLAVILALFFSLARLGKAMRAVADNVDLARLKGIEPVRLAISPPSSEWAWPVSAARFLRSTPASILRPDLG